MIRTGRKILALLLPVILAAAISYMVRVLALWGFARLFDAWNLTAETYVYAPAYAKNIADASGEIAYCLGYACVLIPVCIAFRKRALSGGMCGKGLLFGTACGFGLAVILLGVLLLIGSVRMPSARSAVTLKDISGLFKDVLFFALSAVSVFSCCACISEGKASFGKLAIACAASMLLHAGVFLAFSGFGAAGMMNGLVCGALFFGIGRRFRNAYFEIAALAAFYLTERLFFGFPDWAGGAYGVSEDWLSGAQSGLAASGILLICLTFITVLWISRLFFKRRKELTNAAE